MEAIARAPLKFMRVTVHARDATSDKHCRHQLQRS
jgi:hypothetical protein